MKKIIVANWKMNGSLVFIKSLLPSLLPAFASSSKQIIICPPFPFLASAGAALKGGPVRLGAQTCHTDLCGPFTGEVSAVMLADIGCQAVIVGHSERRALFQESDALVHAKAKAVHGAGMTAIVCIGESREARQSGQAARVVIQSLQASLPAAATPQNTLIAYEPIWAIGAGMTPVPEEIREMHQELRKATDAPFPLLYGGSVAEQNVDGILSLPEVDGVLVGGASLNAASFQKIIE